MRAILLNGSPRKDGNTRYLLDLLESQLRERGVSTRVVDVYSVLSDLDVPFCTACASVCTGACYEDTRLESLFSEMEGVDILVAGSPVYFGTVSAPLKSLWDMTRRLRSSGGLLYTVGAAVSVGGGRFGGQETTLRAVHDMMFIQGMVVVGDSAEGSVGHQGVCAAGPAAEDPLVQERLEALAEGLTAVAGSTRELRAGRT